MNITASTDMPVKEPAYFVNTTTNDFDTTLVRRQLDATNDGHTRRETLTIAAEDIVKARSEIRRRYNTTFLDTPSRDSAAWLLNSLDTPNYLLMRPARIERGAEFMVDKILAYIFTETIDDTGSAARAIQAFRTTQYRMIYYEHIKAFEPSNTTAVIESFVTVSAPVTKIGYTAAMCIILANCVIFGLTLWQFRRSTRSSVLEGGWSAVAQIASNQDARTILQSSTAMTDDQVKSWIDYGAAPPERPRLGLRGALLSVVVGLRHGVGGLFRQRRTRGDRKSPDIRYHVKDGVLRRKQE